MTQLTRTGSPSKSNLSKVWTRLAITSNWPVLAAMAALCIMGVMTVFAVNPNAAYKQGIYMGVGLLAMAAFQIINYQKIGRFAWAFYLLSLSLVGYTVLGSQVSVPGVKYINGAYNWIQFGPASLQPAELMKVAFIMVLARYLRHGRSHRTLPGLIPPLLIAGVPMLLILKQPDLGTALVFIPTTAALLYAAGARLKHMMTLVLMGVMFMPIFWLSGQDLPIFRNMPTLVKEYQRERVFAMFATDEKTLQATGFQQHHALIAFGSGGVTGKGLGQIPVGEKVPEGHNDMIFALLGEQFGFVGSVVVLLAYGALFAAGLEIAANTREPFGRLVAVGIVACLAGQAFLNLMVALKIMPVTGVTLPFVSAGGSSLIASFMAAGLLLNIGQNRPIMLVERSFEFDD